MSRRHIRARSILLLAGAALLILAACSGPAPDIWAAQKDVPLQRLLAERNANRFYDGAPPVIPHEVAALGRENCAGCHTPGDYNNADVIAPPRAHPAWGDCRQCHVERRTRAIYKETTFEPLRYPAKGLRQDSLSPPMIPHNRQNRENCAICHVGEQAPAALRTTHEYRPACRQCHLAMFPRQP